MIHTEHLQPDLTASVISAEKKWREVLTKMNPGSLEFLDSDAPNVHIASISAYCNHISDYDPVARSISLYKALGGTNERQILHELCHHLEPSFEVALDRDVCIDRDSTSINTLERMSHLTPTFVTGIWMFREYHFPEALPALKLFQLACLSKARKLCSVTNALMEHAPLNDLEEAEFLHAVWDMVNSQLGRCLNCGGQFFMRNKRAVYCSGKCRIALYRKTKRK